MDIELLKKALENEDNLSIIETNIQEIKNEKNDILQKIGLDKNNLKQFHKKLKNYRYIDNIKDLKYGSQIRWINLKKIDNIKITNGANLCDIKINDKGIALILSGFNKQYFTIYMAENIIFQKISDQEEILLKAIKYIS
tara:strand:+ start:2887 stop:3303 length:417 start_codon:yes stop_codon:yes gene_type:complete